MTYLDSVRIRNYFNIISIDLNDLGNRREIILMGENGFGKTIVLQALSLGLKGTLNNAEIQNMLNYSSIFPSVSIITTGSPPRISFFDKSRQVFANKDITLFAYGINRLLYDRELMSSKRNAEESFLSLFNSDYKLRNPVQWLLTLDHLESDSHRRKMPLPTITVEKAKYLIGELLNKAIEITIEFKDNEYQVIFSEEGFPNLQFWQLSHGYQSIMIWLCDLISRLAEQQPQAGSLTDYFATVIIDEIEMLLHPTLQVEIIPKLRSLFPKIQWIFTTHSPLVLMGASEDALLLNVSKKDGKINLIQQNIDITNLSPNIIITSPLFQATDVPYHNRDFSKYKTHKSWLQMVDEQNIDDELRNQDSNPDLVNKLNNLLVQ